MPETSVQGRRPSTMLRVWGWIAPAIQVRSGGPDDPKLSPSPSLRGREDYYGR